LQARDDLKSQGKNIKVVHFVRHAQGTHNVEANYRSTDQLDAKLTPLGESQCARLAQEQTRALGGVDLLVTSPLTRCVQTALLSFPAQLDAGLPLVALESVRETVNFVCDRRRPISEIAADFPEVDFSQCMHDEDQVWRMYEDRFGDQLAYVRHRESDDPHHVAKRAREFFTWLEKRNEREVLVATHSAFMWHLFNHGHPGYMEAEGLECSGRDFIPIVEYGDDDPQFEEFMRSRWENCELRSMVVVFEAEP